MAQINVTKQLITAEDIAYGTGTLAQARGGVNLTLNKVRSIMPVNSLAELNALDVTKFSEAVLITATSAIFYRYFSGGWNKVAVETLDLTIPTVADLATFTPVVGKIYYLKEYTLGTNKGGGPLIGLEGSISADNQNTFSGAPGYYFQRVGNVMSSSWDAGIDDAALPSGGVVGTSFDRGTYVGNSAGTTDLRNFLIKSQLNGPYGASLVATKAYQSEIRHTAGTVTFAYGIQGFSRLGRLGSTTGDVTTFRGVEWHTANEGTGDIGTAINFYAQDVDLIDGTGTIDRMIGFLSGNQGHATRVITEAYGFNCADMTGGAVRTVAYNTEISHGAGKFAFRSSSSGKSALAGGLRLGDANQPSDALEVKGVAKLSLDGTVTTPGNYHEINSYESDFIVHFRNTHVSQPNGVRIRFTGAAPNNTTREFLRCEDNASTRILIYSNGNIVNVNNSYGGISDRRLKTNIQDAPSVIDKFRARNFKLYSLIGSENIARGVIAQDELSISPDLVSEDKEGNLSYNYAGLAVEAAQGVGELLKIIDDLQARIKKLESR